MGRCEQRAGVVHTVIHRLRTTLLQVLNTLSTRAFWRSRREPPECQSLMSDSPARWGRRGVSRYAGGGVRRMSLTEMTQRGEEFERMPPHDVAAEQCVLGGMLLSKDAISDVIEVIRPTDHYRPAHQLVHEAILDLYARGEPADPIMVANELTRRGELTRIG